MAIWTRNPEEMPGTKRFSGRALMTSGVQRELTQAELLGLEEQLREAIRENDGLDYLQVFVSDDGRKVWVIDDGSHYTWLLPSEY